MKHKEYDSNDEVNSDENSNEGKGNSPKKHHNTYSEEQKAYAKAQNHNETESMDSSTMCSEKSCAKAIINSDEKY